MSQPPSTRATIDAEFEAIASAVMDTSRGRWFLNEYARRNRNADTRLVLEMLARIERSTARKSGALEADRLRGDLTELAETIARAKSNMAAAGVDASAAEVAREAPKALETIVVTSERTTGDVLNATERIQEVAWMLRERGMPATICNELDTLTAEVYSICAAQDLNHRRIVLLTDLLRLVEGRVETMLAAKRREEAEAQALTKAIEEGRIPSDLHLPRMPEIAPEAATPKLAAPLPAPEARPQPLPEMKPQAAPVPEPVTAVALAPQPVVAAPAPEPAVAAPPWPTSIAAVAPPPVVSAPVAEIAAPAPAEAIPAEPPAAPVRPTRPNFERLSAVERIALFS